ncbi:hypothetical protein CB1_000389015 [Camelus ferus]|nr:hypothetical protein CB1_000389015 [Camelus ferus]
MRSPPRFRSAALADSSTRSAAVLVKALSEGFCLLRARLFGNREKGRTPVREGLADLSKVTRGTVGEDGIPQGKVTAWASILMLLASYGEEPK